MIAILSLQKWGIGFRASEKEVYELNSPKINLEWDRNWMKMQICSDCLIGVEVEFCRQCYTYDWVTWTPLNAKTPSLSNLARQRVSSSILPRNLNHSINKPPTLLKPLKMSDYEDDMDIDAPPARDTVLFGSDNTNSKGKRSAANLPVEAEDSLPWVEKYRPDTLEDVSGHQDILATINKFVETNASKSTRIDLKHLSDSISETSSSPPLRASWYRQNLHHPRPRPKNLRLQEHAPNGSRTQCF
ncbi:hypothetical protein WAI453_003081 [Rhynchosporium graminicola]